ncbi:MAG: hypothetical protein JWR72_4222 [Flavisolibacter sp.]|jgi:uncharacterized protein YkwD|nr:hypothetical protein [Flavisolibacter sp.]
MKALNMISFSLLLAIAFACTKSTDSTEPVIDNSTSTVNKTLMLQLVNDARKKGCQCGDTWYPSAPALTWDVLLEKAALNHSKDMYSNNYFSHTSQDGTGAGVRIDVAGYKWKTYGENIAMGYNTEQAVVEGWLKSPGHCQNIMKASFKEMGVAKVGNYWTQDFGAK